MTFSLPVESEFEYEPKFPVSRKPFLKWAGNKHRIKHHILPHLTHGSRLVEPFSGSCAVSIATDYSKYLIADTNADLINLYKHIKTDFNGVVKHIRALFSTDNNAAERYYELREEFNSSQATVRKSALFVYLNRHCFNGLCRYNASGEFNVPFGRYSSPLAPVQEIVHFAEFAKKCEFREQSFEETFEMVQVGDIVYCDPPYLPLSATSNFSSYGKDGFVDELQSTLADLARKKSKEGVTVIISNHDTKEAERLYFGADIKRFSVKRFISGTVQNRISAPELLAVFRPC